MLCPYHGALLDEALGCCWLCASRERDSRFYDEHPSWWWHSYCVCHDPEPAAYRVKICKRCGERLRPEITGLKKAA